MKDHVRLDHLLSLPQALTISEDRIPPERFWEPIRETVQTAARELVRARSREGANLTADLRRQVRSMERHLGAIKRRLPKALAEQRRRLRGRLQELFGSGATVSTGQLEQAVALVKEADVHEELVRLESHVAYMRQTLAAPPPASARRKRAASVEVAFGNQAGGGVGKRLDFIAQELIREANTMGAKVNDPEAVQHVVDIKGCIERIREQVQNLE
ncbi:MAG: DUF1732 domain-containing protein [Candidatus Omnitrophica bacterium]|nr:DUF1732 domain-containing protein [Candidatus Omnitrophota bacterium]